MIVRARPDHKEIVQREKLKCLLGAVSRSRRQTSPDWSGTTTPTSMTVIAIYRQLDNRVFVIYLRIALERADSTYLTNDPQSSPET